MVECIDSPVVMHEVSCTEEIMFAVYAVPDKLGDTLEIELRLLKYIGKEMKRNRLSGFDLFFSDFAYGFADTADPVGVVHVGSDVPNSTFEYLARRIDERDFTHTVFDTVLFKEVEKTNRVNPLAALPVDDFEHVVLKDFAGDGFECFIDFRFP